MPRASNGSVEIEWQSFGDANAETVLLVNGLGSQMTRWPEAFCGKLVAKGYRAIRLDNRDTGLSTWPADKYALTDMADDAVAVLNAAGVKKAHIAGVSMGGMIVQRIALDHPDRVLSMTSIMSTTGEPSTMNPAPVAGGVLTQPAPDPAQDYEAYVAHGVRNARIIGSPAHPWTDEEIRGRVVAEHARAFNPAGVARQMFAVRGDGDRTEALRGLKIPVVVLHGADDPLLTKVGGEATAAAIPGAELRIIPGMGHDLPPGLYDIFVDAITAAAVRAQALAWAGGVLGPLALALVALLVAIGLLHLSWAFGAVWPGADEADLVARAIGRTRGGRMPSRAATLSVASAILSGAAMVALVSAHVLPAPVSTLALVAYAAFVAVFLLRGLSVFVPAVWRYAEGTPFHRLNRLYYSPLCLLIAVGLTANLFIR